MNHKMHLGDYRLVWIEIFKILMMFIDDIERHKRIRTEGA